MVVRANQHGEPVYAGGLYRRRHRPSRGRAASKTWAASAGTSCLSSPSKAWTRVSGRAAFDHRGEVPEDGGRAEIVLPILGHEQMGRRSTSAKAGDSRAQACIASAAFHSIRRALSGLGTAVGLASSMELDLRPGLLRFEDWFLLRCGGFERRQIHAAAVRIAGGGAGNLVE